MPMFDYECSACSNEFPELVRVASELVVCPKCGAESKRVWKKGPIYKWDAVFGT
jgi:putative FmdB family regulatory protein